MSVCVSMCVCVCQCVCINVRMSVFLCVYDSVCIPAHFGSPLGMYVQCVYTCTLWQSTRDVCTASLRALISSGSSSSHTLEQLVRLLEHSVM